MSKHKISFDNRMLNILLRYDFFLENYATVSNKR